MARKSRIGHKLRRLEAGSGPPRMVVADSRGRFRLNGLADDRQLRVSAKVRHDAGDFISEQLLLSADVQEYEIKLKSEDPVFPGRKKL